MTTEPVVQPDFTIVTISYNQARFLQDCIESVLAQEGVTVEYIVIDAGSTDGSRDLIQRYQDRITRIVFEPDDGPADALNKGLAMARGRFFGYVNSDDGLVSGALARVAACFRRWSDIDVVYGNGVLIDDDNRLTAPVYSTGHFTPELYARDVATIIQQSAFCRTEALRRAGGFNRENRTCWDGEAFLDMAMSGSRFRRVWDVFGVFRIHAGSISGSGRLEERYRDDCRRIAERVLGRPKNGADRLLDRLAYLGTRLTDLRRLLAVSRRALMRRSGRPVRTRWDPRLGLIEGRAGPE